MLSDYKGSISPQASMNQGRKTETDKKQKSVQKNKIGKEEDQLDMKFLTLVIFRLMHFSLRVRINRIKIKLFSIKKKNFYRGKHIFLR